jgi:hypothetical protein
MATRGKGGVALWRESKNINKTNITGGSEQLVREWSGNHERPADVNRM